MNYHIKNMVCPRCILAVQQILDSMNLSAIHIQLGMIITDREFTKEELNVFSERLTNIGFELLTDSQEQLIEQIKAIIIAYIRQKEIENVSISELIIKKMNRDYSSLSKLFSSTEGYTIEQYTIMQRIEQAKELLSYDQLTLSEIALEMGYSSVAHLSSQFKKITGMTPTQFKKQTSIQRKPIDSI